MKKTLEIFIDGASRGNPGPASIGVVIKDNNKIIKEISRSIGEATNNVAEYTALIFALQEALLLGAMNIKIYTDSELLFHQIQGQYKVKNQRLKLFYELAGHLKAGFEHIEFNHVLRDKNKDADRLASEALKVKQVKMVASLF